MVRILLDEDLDVRLRKRFGRELAVETVLHRGWNGKKNGELLRLAQSSFDVLVTADTNLSYQQNLPQYGFAVVGLRPRSKALSHLEELVPAIERVIPQLRPGTWVELRPEDP